MMASDEKRMVSLGSHALDQTPGSNYVRSLLPIVSSLQPMTSDMRLRGFIYRFLFGSHGEPSHIDP